jgi:hypothetical protein
MHQQYEVWVVVDPAVQNWTKVEADSLQNAAEQAVLEYDQRSDVDFSLAKEGTIVQVLVRDPADTTHAYSFDASCTLNPFYELTSIAGTRIPV